MTVETISSILSGPGDGGAGGHPTRRRRRRSGTLIAGAVIVGIVLLAAAFAPLVATHDPIVQDLTAGLQPPSAAHWLGTDQLGRDIWSRIVYAARTDLRVGVLAVATPAVLGIALGLLAGYFGGWTDRIASYLVDTNLAFPFYVIVLAMVTLLGTGEGAIYLTFALVAWVNYTRVVGVVTAGFARENWVLAARGGGLGHVRVMVRHVLPNALPQIVVLVVNDIVFVILAVVTLSYLGLGIQPPTPDWGGMISDGQAFLTSRPWISLAPGAALFVTAVGFSLLADGIADVLRDER
ncbi:ABC transporter permease [Herbiconiux moechotypicola]|uniref:ABC transporter permease n=1 Tax=Herbiconiux moechotypicola TaxID=637393 RepID=A0ABN3D934_9MICO|nr:ABC transporter permease [Herbiconiux moechotypicola]MCS5728167.1 ABC transporter permease [Herbiconiux moechotypicola]